jgi:hypothetical protein
MALIVDRPNRDALIAAINRYIDGKTTAFNFDEEIFSIKSNDPTISHIVCQLWYFYDDCKDHKVQLSKEAWDYIQRMILLLQSDAKIEFSKRRRWDFTQLIAMAALLLFVYEAYWLGWGKQLLALAIPFGLVSIAISWWRGRKSAGAIEKSEIALMPFASISELLPLRRRVTSFRKRKYPPGMKQFNIRSPLMNFAITLQSYALWAMISPLLLIFQALPIKETDTRVILER